MTGEDSRRLLTQRLAHIEGRIAAACARAGRDRRDVTLVAVTKTVTAEIAAILPGLGIMDLGESRPQELWHKAAAISLPVRWHLVGHLQRNKVERTLPFASLIHSVDSVRLLDAIRQEAEQQDRTVDVLLEVNVSREPNKQGFAPETLSDRLRELQGRTGRVRIQGLMTMAAIDGDADSARAAFAELRQRRDDLRQRFDDTAIDLRHLSMGMTNDFEIGIEEGATIIRIGTALFEGLAGSLSG